MTESKDPKKYQPLPEQIEAIRDTYDEDVLPHVQHFANRFKENVTLGKIDLQTQHSALQSLEVIKETHKALERQQRIVQALRAQLPKESSES